MTIKMYFGQTEIKIEAHIRDRKFTFTSAFETMEREMMQALSSQTNVLSIKPDENNNDGYGNHNGMYGYTGNASGSNVSSSPYGSSRPPSLPSSRENGYPSPMSNARSVREEDGTFYDGDSRHSSTMNGNGNSRKIFGIKFGKKR